MALLLKDCGLNGCKGSVERCEECRRATVHFRRPGGWPVCGICGAFASRAAGRREIAARHTAPLLAQALLAQAAC